MKKHLLFIFSLVILVNVNAQEVTNLRVESQANPVGIGNQNPSFSWIISSAGRNVHQVGYQVLVATSHKNLSPEKADVWNSGRIVGDKSVFVSFGGKKLESCRKYFWKVKVWTNKGESAWSSIAEWRMDFLNESDWKATWIMSDLNKDITHPAPMFRKEFIAGKRVKSAIAVITSYGWYEAEINGQRVGDAYFTPGWTSFKTRLQYQMYDVTSLVVEGKNAVGIRLGNGWYRERFLGMPVMAPHSLAVLFQMEVTYTDGTKETIISDDSWKTAVGEIRENSLYAGQVTDKRLEKNGWTSPAHNDTDWIAVKTAELGYRQLIATQNEPVKKHESFKPVKIITTPKGENVIDFGQNLVGWVKFKAAGNLGDTITISHAEVLDEQGNFYTENLRKAKAEAIYILKGNGEEVLEPVFSFFGFRYIRVKGLRGKINPDDFTAIALYSDLQQTGTFNCSDSLVNQLQKNIVWGQKGNFIDVPTDCPQRDERLGWTADAQVFFRTAAFNMDVYNFFRKWLIDLQIAQKKDGVIPWVAPDALVYLSDPASGWSDAVTIIPWNMYRLYGDTSILADMYGNMKAWVDYMNKKSVNHLFTLPSQFGDWLFYSPTPDDKGMAAITDKGLISQCFYIHSTQLLIKAGSLLGKTSDVASYSENLENIKKAFLHEYMTPSGKLVSSTQTAYVLALQFDVLPEEFRLQAARRLAENIKLYKNHLTTGFLGTSYLPHVLTRFGYTDIAYSLLLQKTYPSWLYPVTKGATTIWERWDGIKPDGTLQTPAMNSFNHYAYGAIGEWLYSKVAGIEVDDEVPGYKKIIIKPYISNDLSYAVATLLTNYGKVVSNWRKENGKFSFDVEIPANTTAVVFIPGDEGCLISENGIRISDVKDVHALGYKDGYFAVGIGSGKYSFTSTLTLK